MLYTYGLCPPLDPALSLPLGIVRPVRWVGTADLGAIVEFDVDLDGLLEDDQQLQQAVLAHDRVLTTLCQATPILPLSFGTRLMSETALLEHLAAEQSHYLSRLEHIGDRVEFLIKCLPVQSLAAIDEAAAPTSGRDYFRAKKAQLQAQAAQQHRRQAQFEHLYQAMGDRFAQLAYTPSEDGVERIYVLAERSATATLDALLVNVFNPWPQPLWSVSRSQPLPPYHFV